MSVAWQGIKELCRSCITLLANDEAFDCKFAGNDGNWTCQTCWATDADGIGHAIRQCGFPNSRSISHGEKDAYRHFVQIHGKKARSSPGGHIAAAQRIKLEQTPALTASQPNPDTAPIKPQLIVKLLIGQRNALRLAGRQPSEESHSILIASRQSSPQKIEVPKSPIEKGDINPISSVLSSRRPSLKSRYGSNQSSEPEISQNDGSDRSGTPRKWRRLHQGLKTNSVPVEPLGQVAEAVMMPVKRSGSFQTNADLMARFKDTVDRRGSEDRSQSSRLGTSTPLLEREEVLPKIEDRSSRQLTKDPTSKFDNFHRISEDIGQDHPTTAEETSINASDLSNYEAGLASVPVKPLLTASSSRKHSFLSKPPLLVPQSQEIIVLDTDSESRSRSASLMRDDRDQELHPDVHEPTTQIDLDDSPEMPPESLKPHDADYVGPPISESTTAQEPQNWLPNSLNTSLQSAVEFSDRPLYQGPVTIDLARNIFGASVPNQTRKAASIPVSPLESHHKAMDSIVYSMPPAPVSETEMEPKHDIASPASAPVSSEPRRSTHVVPIITSTEQTEESQQVQDKEDTVSRKRASMADDYLMQMVAHAKKSRSDSQAAEEARPNAFTPINQNSSTSDSAISSQIINNSGAQASKASGQLKRKGGGRRPKAQNPADLRTLAPAPNGQDTTRAPAQIPSQTTKLGNDISSYSEQINPGSGVQGKANGRKHHYAFLNHKRGSSRGGINSSPSSTASTHLPGPSNPLHFQRSQPAPSVDAPAVNAKVIDYGDRDTSQEPQAGMMPLPSPADSESYLSRPQIDNADVHSHSYENTSRPQSHAGQASFGSDVQRRHSTQIHNIIHQPSQTQLNHLNRPLPSQIMTGHQQNNKYRGNVPNNLIQGPSQIYSAPMTPNGQFPSPQEGTFGSFQISNHSTFAPAPTFHTHPSRPAIPSPEASNEGAIRHFIEQTHLHVFAPQNEGDFEIVRLGAYSGAATFITKALSTQGEVATKVAKLKITFAWMPEGTRGRSLTMRLDSVEGKELAFKHVCEKITERYNAGNGGLTATLDVDVILKEREGVRRE